MDTFADFTEEVNKIHSPIKEECFQLLSNFDVEFDTDVTEHYPFSVADSSEQSVKYAVESLWFTLLSNIKGYPSPIIKHTHRENVGKIIFRSANRFSCVNTCSFDKLIYCFKSPVGLTAEINFKVVKY